MSATNKADNHAQQNAIAWMETIREYVACLQADRERLEEIRDERDGWDTEENDSQTWAEANPDDAEELNELVAAVTVEGEELDEEQIRERIEQSPLSVEVRGGWYTPGASDQGPEEYQILLSTGGPALRIIGELGVHSQPTSARLQYQDWFTPWTEHIVTGDDHKALMAFVSVFYFGD